MKIYTTRILSEKETRNSKKQHFQIDTRTLPNPSLGKFFGSI